MFAYNQLSCCCPTSSAVISAIYTAATQGNLNTPRIYKYGKTHFPDNSFETLQQRFSLLCRESLLLVLTAVLLQVIPLSAEWWVMNMAR
jgi:hypothetical protein